MPINISVLDDSGSPATEQQYTLISKDRTTSEWINSTKSSTTRDERLSIAQSIVGKNKLGSPIRRSLVKNKLVLVSDVPGSPEEATVNLTITLPTVATNLTSTMVADLVYEVRDLCTVDNIKALMQGQV